MFQYMRLDFTVAQMQIEGRPNGRLEYEVELEIADIKYVAANLQQPDHFKGIVRRYLQNAFSLPRLMFSCRKTIDYEEERRRQEQIDKQE